KFARTMELIECNTCYKKDESKKITYESGDSKSEIDYILVRTKERSVVKDVTTISGEVCATQHKLLLCKIKLSQSVPKKKKERPIDRCRLWKLEQKETSAEYCEEVRLKAEERSEGNVDSVWKEFSECLTTAANKICGK